MATARDFDIALLSATKEIMVALIESKRVTWDLNARVEANDIKEDAAAIADALRGATTKTR
ncbi:hypothetical protein MYX64_06520 [Nitrospinae bacterium AH_259_B05_G02_I21]|nr:hypothetical protein [Nitrospinae bacterium AH_259_B05_G02_I21]